MNKIREKFVNENNVNVYDGLGETFTLYIKWLEEKLQEKESNFDNPLLSEVRADEIIKIIKELPIMMPIDDFFDKEGNRITKKEYGKVLIKYLCIELREKLSEHFR